MIKYAGTASILVILLGAAVLTGAQRKTGSPAPREPGIMTPSDQLEQEHLIILQVIDAAKTEAAAIREQESPDTGRIRQMMDFFSRFVDDCHHAKEEKFYFLSATYHGPPEIESMVRELKMEHAYARSILEELRFALDEGEPNADFIAERFDTYTTLVERHIQEENERLFPKADVYITGAEERAILMGFKKIEEVDLGTGFHEKYQGLADELAHTPGDSE